MWCFKLCVRDSGLAFVFLFRAGVGVIILYYIIYYIIYYYNIIHILLLSIILLYLILYSSFSSFSSSSIPFPIFLFSSSSVLFFLLLFPILLFYSCPSSLQYSSSSLLPIHPPSFLLPIFILYLSALTYAHLYPIANQQFDPACFIGVDG